MTTAINVTIPSTTLFEIQTGISECKANIDRLNLEMETLKTQVAELNNDLTELRESNKSKFSKFFSDGK